MLEVERNVKNRQTCKTRAHQKGFTLVEFLMSLTIAMLVLGGMIMALLYMTLMSTASKREAQVFQDVQLTMERVSGTDLTSLNIQFPDNQALTSTFVSDVLGGYKLPGESITVSYPSGTNTNPREVVVTGSWPDRGATRTTSLRTYIRG